MFVRLATYAIRRSLSTPCFAQSHSGYSLSMSAGSGKHGGGSRGARSDCRRDRFVEITRAERESAPHGAIEIRSRRGGRDDAAELYGYAAGAIGCAEGRPGAVAAGSAESRVAAISPVAVA